MGHSRSSAMSPFDRAHTTSQVAGEKALGHYELLATCGKYTVLMYLTCQKILSNSQYGICSLVLYSVDGDF